MAPGIAENLDEKRRGSLDHLGLIGEVRVAVYKTAEPDHLNHLVQVAAAGILEVGDKVEGAKARRLLALLDGEVDTPTLPVGPNSPFPNVDLAGQENQLPATV